nr:hypothetical protein [Corynebacterium atrinae]
MNDACQRHKPTCSTFNGVVGVRPSRVARRHLTVSITISTTCPKCHSTQRSVKLRTI